jgi:hypothetical protein
MAVTAGENERYLIRRDISGVRDSRFSDESCEVMQGLQQDREDR